MLFWLCLSLAAGVIVVQAVLLDWELPGPFFVAGRWDTWCVHHDEKLVIPDVRAFALGQAGPARLSDYLPYPVSAAFGVAGPWLSVAGMWLAGFGNVGLRLWSLGAMALRQYCFLGLCFALLPPWPAAAVFCLQLLSYNQFVLDHHAVLENLLGLALVFMAWRFVADPAGAAAGAFGWGLVISALALVKPNFPFTVGLLALCLLTVGPEPRTAGLACLGGLVLGFAGFEAIQAVVLWRQGFLRHRYRNLLDVMRVHRGMEHEYLQKFIKPIGWRVVPRFFVLTVDWLADSHWRNVPASAPGPVAFALACLVCLIAPVGGGSAAAGLAVFVVLHLAMCLPFFYYPKRVTPVLPLYYLLAAVQVLAWGRWLGVPGVAAGLCLLAVAVGAWNLWLFVAAVPGRTRGVAEQSRRLEALTKPGSRIRMQCYPYRFLWQARGRVMLSGDDQVLDNVLTEEAAQRENADYLLLASLDAGERDRLGLRHRWLGRLETSAADSDMAMQFDLFQRDKTTT
jgi:hypothetical protein